MPRTEAQCLDFFSEILSVLTSSRHYERVFHFVVDRLVRTFNCRACAIVLIDSETEYLSVENYHGISRTFCKEFRKHLATGAIGELLWTGNPVLIQDARQLPDLARDVQLEQPFESCAIVQIAIHHRSLGYLFADSMEKNTFTDGDLPTLNMFASVAAIALYQNKLYDENLRMDRIDHETDLERYTAFSDRLVENLARARTADEGLGIIIFDIDNFKSICNTYGSMARKNFLKEIGTLVKSHLRPFDRACRYGPDEVMILLPNTTVADTVNLARSVCDSVRQSRFTEHSLNATVSGGVSVFPEDGSDIEDLILSAKHSVFEAQRAGRDKIFRRQKEALLNNMT